MSMVLAVAVATSCATCTSSGASATPTVIVLDSPENLNTISPAPDTSARMTAGQAYAVFVRANPRFELKLADATGEHLGYLTAAVGNGTYTQRHRLVWGFTFDWPEVRIGVNPRHPSPFPSPRSHTWWLFLDANTGTMVQGEWQMGA